MQFDEIHLPDWNNVAILGRNKLPARSYFIHYPNARTARGNRLPSASPMVTTLGGKWSFKYLDSAQKLEADDITGPMEGWREIPVPSVWQLQGVERPFYVNVAFPFPATPPLVPFLNPVGVYRRTFEAKKAKTRILTFLGVSSAFHVYLNGVLAGYSEGSHNSAEFDVSHLVKAGSNEIAVVVYKWCNGSYLECQDMFRHNGIFRDVFLTELPAASVFDIASNSRERDGGFEWEASVTIRGSLRGTACITLTGEEGVVACSGTIPLKRTLLFKQFLPHIRRWTAETPHIYHLSVSIFSEGKECDFAEVVTGFRTVSTEGGVFRVNGVPIKCKGVNHHDTHPRKGFALSVDDYERDVRLMKAFNVDTVRFSHYPPHPYMLELCDTYGIYVVDEADIESHGELFMKEGPAAFSNRKDFRPAFLDRTLRLYRRDKNHPCVIMWSLGNESGFGRNHMASYRMLKKLTDTPIHYEGSRERKGCPGLDVISNMYPPIPEMKRVLAAYKGTLPYFLCEYAHCMGVGPGNLKGYWELMESEPQCMGGCIWEFADHCYLEKGDFRYGGDGGEYITDGDFCADGMFLADRTPRSSAFEVKNAYRPVVSRREHNKLIFFNRRSFTDTSDITIVLEWTEGDEAVKRENLVEAIPPRSTWEYTLPDGAPARFLNISYRIGERTVGEEQHELKEFSGNVLPAGYSVSAHNGGRYLTVEGEKQKVVFDLADGSLICWQQGGFEAINQAPRNSGLNPFGGAARGFLPNLMRRGISNDMVIRKRWDEELLFELWHNVRSVSWTKEEGHVAVRVLEDLTPHKKDRFAETELLYRIYGDRIELTASIRSDFEEKVYLPRFGVRAELSPGLDAVEYFGYGPRENETDFLLAARRGRYECKLEELNGVEAKPQEGGVRTGVEQFALRSPKSGNGVEILATNAPLCVAAYPFPAEAFDAFRHRREVRPMGTTQVMIDGFRSGVGSQSCGHPPLEEQRFYLSRDWQSFSFAARLVGED